MTAPPYGWCITGHHHLCPADTGDRWPCRCGCHKEANHGGR